MEAARQIVNVPPLVYTNKQCTVLVPGVKCHEWKTCHVLQGYAMFWTNLLLEVIMLSHGGTAFPSNA